MSGCVVLNNGLTLCWLWFAYEISLLLPAGYRQDGRYE